MSNWIYIDDIEVTNNVNTIHCDTRDFHCSVREDKIELSDAKYPEITRVLRKKNSEKAHDFNRRMKAD